jgi:hypothetical protein
VATTPSCIRTTLEFGFLLDCCLDTAIFWVDFFEFKENLTNSRFPFRDLDDEEDEYEEE